MNKQFVSAILLLTLNTVLLAQNVISPLGHQFRHFILPASQNRTVNYGFYPLSQPLTKTTFIQPITDTTADNSISNRIFNNDLAIYKDNPAHFYVNPLFWIEKKQSLTTDSAYITNTRGIEIHGNIGTKLFFSTTFRENQARYPAYINHIVTSRRVVPGQGAWKDFENGGRDFASASGILLYQPTKYLSLLAGTGKNFIGYGYRSLILSDNAFNYPYFRVSIAGKKWNYQWLTAQFQYFGREYYYYHYRKYFSAFAITYKPFQNLEIAVIEATVWNNMLNNSYTAKPPLLFYVPLAFVNTAINGLNVGNNSMVALQLCYTFKNYASLYSQSILDNYGKNNVLFITKGIRYGIQNGIKISDIFAQNIPYLHWFLLSEYNLVSPYTYSSPNPAGNFSHYKQELTHPLGSNFTEWIVQSRITYRFFNIYANYQIAHTVSDTTDTNFGKNIFLVNNPLLYSKISTNSQIADLNKTILKNSVIGFSVTLNASTGLQLYAEIQQRSINISGVTNTQRFINAGITTKLENFYFDF